MKNVTESSSFAQGVAFGHCTAWLETFAERSNLPFALLAERVGALLLGAASGATLGTGNSMPTMRREATQRSTSVEPLEMARSTHRKPQIKSSRLGTERGVTCPTCNAGKGEYCVSIGSRVGASSGAVMSTSCHAARIFKAGLLPKRYTKGKDPVEVNKHKKKIVWTLAMRQAASERMRLNNPKRRHLNGSEAPVSNQVQA